MAIGTVFPMREEKGKQMILTPQLDRQQDERARALLEKHSDGSYKLEPSYYASMFAGAEHVATSYLDVIRAGWERIDPAARRDPAKRETRREFILQMVSAHLGNRDLVREFRF